MEELFNAHGWKITKEEASLPDGRIANKVRAEFADTVSILAFDEKRKILLIREYRPFWKEWVWMLPGGHIENETDHTNAALRELREETGFSANSIRLLWRGYNEEIIKKTDYFFEAKSLFIAPLEQDNDELIEVHSMEPREALRKVESSPVLDLLSAYGLQRWMKENS
jgi:ADP-ribose pyrophosphatase